MSPAGQSPFSDLVSLHDALLRLALQGVITRNSSHELITDQWCRKMNSKAELYSDLNSQLRSLIEGEPDLIANAANFASLLYQSLPDLNWAGFYFLKENELVLGPFQGQPACVRIEIGKGVCGTAAQQRATILVDDVHQFPGHIACDMASNSEIVVPLIKNTRLLGVLDLDSPSVSRFDDQDAEGLNTLVNIFIESVCS